MSPLDDGTAESLVREHMEAIGEAVSNKVLCVIARRLGVVPQNAGMADVYRWLAQDLGRIDELFMEGADAIGRQGGRELEALADEVDRWAAPYYEARGVRQAVHDDNVYMQHILRQSFEVLDHDVANMCRTSAALIVAPDGRYLPLRQAYADWATRAVIDMMGGKPRDAVVAKAVEALSGSGLRVRYASGATRDLYSAVSMNVSDGFAATMDSLRDRAAVEFGADGVAVSAHAMCAPDHQRVQGRRFTFAEFDELQATMKRPIGRYNCRHHVTKIVMGVGGGAYDADDRRQLIEASNREVRFRDGGRERSMTAYEFTQRQRQMETRCRKLRGAAQVADAGGQRELAERLRGRASDVADAYRRQSREAGVGTREERLQVYDWSVIS